MSIKLSIRHWKYSQIRAAISEIKSLLVNLQFIPHPHRYLRLARIKHKELFRKLSAIGFFSFHSTNNGYTCYLHQITLYLATGWKLYRNEGQFCECGLKEIHHLDSDPTNNDPSNLTYITPHQNKALSVMSGTRYFGTVITEHSLHNFQLTWLFKQTMRRTFDRLALLSLSAA